jgi:hypothetical protein
VASFDISIFEHLGSATREWLEEFYISHSVFKVSYIPPAVTRYLESKFY